MTTPQLHADAVLVRLRTHGGPTLTAMDVFDAEVDSTASVSKGYLVVDFEFLWQGAATRPDASNLSGDSLALQVTATVYSVGATARAVRALINRGKDALLDWTPVVAGRSCSPTRHEDDYSRRPDERTGVAHHESVDVYRFTSHPA